MHEERDTQRGRAAHDVGATDGHNATAHRSSFTRCQHATAAARQQQPVVGIERRVVCQRVCAGNARLSRRGVQQQVEGDSTAAHFARRAPQPATSRAPAGNVPARTRWASPGQAAAGAAQAGAKRTALPRGAVPRRQQQPPSARAVAVLQPCTAGTTVVRRPWALRIAHGGCSTRAFPGHDGCCGRLQRPRLRCAAAWRGRRSTRWRRSRAAVPHQLRRARSQATGSGHC